MFETHLKTAWRNIIRNKTFSALNIIGLAVSLTAFILIALYIEDELSFDRFNENAANIYRVVDDKQTPDVLLHSAQTAAPVAPALLQEFPDIKQAVRLIQSESLVKYNEKIFEERNMFFADESIFKIFSFTMLAGNADNALTAPGSIVLTSSVAKKYFGNEVAVGKVLLLDGKTFSVTGVVNDMPANAHLQFDFLISMKTAQEINSGYDWMFSNWYSNNFWTYVLVPANYNIDKLQTQMAAFDMRHRETNGNTIHHYAFEKLTDIYLHSDRDNQIGKTGSITNLYIFSVIALFILLIACINFVNLSTARSVLRAKEVAVKKVAGAARGEIATQFFTESFLMCGIALSIAVILSYTLLPAFNSFCGKSISNFISPLHFISFAFLFLFIGLLSGSYPAFVLSGFKPAIALKGKVSSSGWSIMIRKGLVVFQFAISVILTICSMIVYTQMHFLQEHDLGFKKNQTLVINFEGDHNVQQRLDVIKQQLLQIPDVKGITASSNVPGDGNIGGWSMDFIKINGDTIHTEMPLYSGDYNYLSNYNIPVVAGRTLSAEYGEDSTSSMLINEAAVKQLGFRSADEAIGVRVGMYPADARIVGVVKDFHFESLQKAIAPLAIRPLSSRYRQLSLEINTNNVQQTIAAIEKVWKALVPERPIEYSFLDESFNRQYQAEIKFGQVFNIFALIAIVIACLGLFGLALFSVQQRTKEIGVRKVLGANVTNIVTVLSKDFLKLVVIAIIIASPVAYFFMYRWLSDFAYRTPISVWIFLVAGFSAVCIALITVSYQTIKAAIMNPVKSLRTE